MINSIRYRKMIGGMFILLLIALLTGPAAAQSDTDLSPRLLFVVSGGYWEEEPELIVLETDEEPGGDAVKKGTDDAASGEEEPQRGYYRVVVFRSENNTSRIFLQQISLTEDGPVLYTSLPLNEFEELPVYVTDLRPEASDGSAVQLGFAAYVYLKTDPDQDEPETWSIYIDDFGDLYVEPASN